MEFNIFKDKFNKTDIKQLNPLVLAFIGDSVYDVFIRTYLIDKNRDMLVHKLHVKATTFVKAKAQSDIMKKIMDNLNEEETSIFKRARNTKSNTVPKNANVGEYRAATGFEALIGYLYLTEQNERLNEILELCI